MNYNVSAYLVFIVLIMFIIIYVGRYFYTNGRVFIIVLLKGNESLADYINRLLLAGYYLVNIGYAFLKLKSWGKINSVEEWLSSLGVNIGTLILVLAFLHYVNMLVIYLLSKSDFKTHKRFHYE
jgi:hypothetical protein